MEIEKIYSNSNAYKFVIEYKHLIKNKDLKFLFNLNRQIIIKERIIKLNENDTLVNYHLSRIINNKDIVICLDVILYIKRGMEINYYRKCLYKK
jgi:hypothetical protein